MNLPPLRKKEVTIGYSGIELVSRTELEDHQLGYSVTDDGKSLIGNEIGDWKAGWIVIGHETNCGDPIFIDSDHPKFPVYTAMHGAGSWEPQLICPTYDAFLQVIDKLSELAIGREYPTKLEEKPMTQKEYDDFLSFVEQKAKVEDSYFWALLVSDEDAGIGPEI